MGMRSVPQFDGVLLLHLLQVADWSETFVSVCALRGGVEVAAITRIISTSGHHFHHLYHV